MSNGSNRVGRSDLEYQRYALAYAERGYAVFPCKQWLQADGRKGFVAPDDWPGLSTSDPDEVREGLAELPRGHGLQLAIDTGKSGLAVADLDIKNGENGPHEWSRLRAEYGGGRTWLRAQTWSGGSHWLYRQRDDDPVYNSTRDLAPGIDTRGIGGLIIVAPSVMPGTGQGYRWTEPTDIENIPHVDDLPLIPAWVPELLRAAAKSRGNAPKVFTGPVDIRYEWKDLYPRQRAAARELLYELVSEILAAVEGTRNHALYHASARAAGYIKVGKLPAVPTIDAIRAAGEETGLPAWECDRTVTSAMNLLTSGAGR
ncbi:bifunctional DNA primase/polymerase [Frankia tisae]|uniref:bifunctional DNA primase/polymerase n=1 Tax=Frankia tisae TaxID=2950104 RepID=UPI0021BEDD38|nr:bifunctional DNA primase/polymerase [Frankia tisae]